MTAVITSKRKVDSFVAKNLLDQVPDDNIVHFIGAISAGRAQGVLIFVPVDENDEYDPTLHKMAILFGKTQPDKDRATASFLDMFQEGVRLRVYEYEK
jgi:hypothetical protein